MTFTRGRRAAAAVLSAAVAASLGLAACGGSSSSSSSSASATTTTTGPGRFAALRTCLAQNGITLPQRPAGAPRPPGAAAPGGGLGLGLGAGGAARTGGGGLARRLPAGVTAAQFQAALKKCGGGPVGGRAFGARRLQTPAAKAALASFVTCMQGKGVKLPAANTTGTGPVFNTRGINTTTAQFKTAYAACQPLLAAVFPRRAGAAGAGAAAGGGATTTAPGAP
jgi:hypothetical protein